MNYFVHGGKSVVLEIVLPNGTILRCRAATQLYAALASEECGKFQKQQIVIRVAS